MSSMLVRNVVLMMALIALIMVVPYSDSATPNEEHFHTRWTVHVVNQMETGGVLLLHCKSRDDDLNVHYLAYKQEFAWTFRENWWQTTLFWCYFKSLHGHATFDVYWQERKHTWLEFRCGGNQCIWTARDDGIYLKNIPLNIEDYKHDWNKTIFVRRRWTLV